MKLYDDVMDSDAFRLLSPLSRALFVEFIRRVQGIGRYDASAKRPHVLFTWTSSEVVCTRVLFGKARAELIHFGFVKPFAVKQGLYRPSNAFRRYEASASERDRLARVDARRAEQRARTRMFRGASSDRKSITGPVIENRSLGDEQNSPVIENRSLGDGVSSDRKSITGANEGGDRKSITGPVIENRSLPSDRKSIIYVEDRDNDARARASSAAPGAPGARPPKGERERERGPSERLEGARSSGDGDSRGLTGAERIRNEGGRAPGAPGAAEDARAVVARILRAVNREVSPGALDAMVVSDALGRIARLTGNDSPLFWRKRVPAVLGLAGGEAALWALLDLLSERQAARGNLAVERPGAWLNVCTRELLCQLRGTVGVGS